MFLSTEIENVEGTVFCSTEEEENGVASFSQDSLEDDCDFEQLVLTNGDLVWKAIVDPSCVNKNLQEEGLQGTIFKKRVESWFSAPYSLKLTGDVLIVSKEFGQKKRVGVASIQLEALANKAEELRGIMKRALQIISGQSARIESLKGQVVAVKQSYDVLLSNTKASASEMRKQKDELTLKMVQILNAKKDALRMARGLHEGEDDRDEDEDVGSRKGSDSEASDSEEGKEEKEESSALKRKQEKTKAVRKSKELSSSSSSSSLKISSDKMQKETGRSIGEASSKASSAKEKSPTEDKKEEKSKKEDDLPPYFSYVESNSKPGVKRFYYHKILWVEGDRKNCAEANERTTTLPKWYLSGKPEHKKLMDWRKKQSLGTRIMISSKNPPFKGKDVIEDQSSNKGKAPQKRTVPPKTSSSTSTEKEPLKTPAAKRATAKRTAKKVQQIVEEESSDSSEDSDGIANVFGNHFGRSTRSGAVLSGTQESVLSLKSNTSKRQRVPNSVEDELSAKRSKAPREDSQEEDENVVATNNAPNKISLSDNDDDDEDILPI